MTEDSLRDDNTRNKRNLLIIAVFASSVTIVLDIISQWSPLSPSLFADIASANFDAVPPGIAARVAQLQSTRGTGWTSPFLFSHYLALVFFPAAMAGIPALLPGRDGLSHTARVTGYAAYISGMAYHMSMSFLAAALGSVEQTQWNAILDGYGPFMDALGYIFSAAFVLVSILYMIGEYRQHGKFTWRILANPAVSMLAVIVLSFLFPPPARAVLRIVSFNAGMFVCYLFHLAMTLSTKTS